MTVALGGCARYAISSTPSPADAKGPVTVRVGLRDGARALAVRVTNKGTGPLGIQWSGAHLRDPDGFEAPVMVEPEGALETVYAGGTIEYTLRPGHLYLPADRRGARRNRLVRHLAARRGASAYTLFLPVCAGWSCDDWALHSVDFVVTREGG